MQNPGIPHWKKRSHRGGKPRMRMVLLESAKENMQKLMAENFWMLMSEALPTSGVGDLRNRL